MTKEKHIILWLYICCFMVFAMAVIGAITRLTESGLSMVEWRPLIGTLPPLNEAEWQRVYELYKQSPEFMHKHNWMALEDFKHIFFREWFHRLWGRAIGLVYALPLLWFWIRKQIPAGYGWKLLGPLVLGGGQGLLGWCMVKSGLADRPEVSHYRLAAHLALALLIFALIWWVALDLKNNEKTTSSRIVLIHGWLSLALLSITIIWGAFTAGLDAGMIYNSFPLMDGSFLPPETAQPLAVFEQHAWVQFTHRWLAITSFVLILGLAHHVKDFALAGMAFVQVGLGISTLLTQVWIPLAALHQAGAIILLALLLRAVHRLNRWAK
jgi:heme a synthase